jgi:hypothetical protein
LRELNSCEFSFIEERFANSSLSATLTVMPRYGTRTLLIAFALVAVWFATFGASSTSMASVMAAQDVRRSMLLLVLIAATGVAIASRGRRRAFWTAFAIVMFACGGLNLQRPLHRYVPEFAWQQVVGAPVVTPYLAPTPAPVAAARTTGRGQVVYSYSAPAPYTVTTAGMGGSSAWIAFSETAAATWTFALAALSGFIAAYIYSRPPATATSTTPRQIVEQELHR